MFHFLRQFSLIPLAATILFCFSACTSTRVQTPEQELANQRITEPLIILPPVAYDPELQKTCDSFGDYLCVEAPKRVDGNVIYANDIESLRPMLSWKNLIKDGAFDQQEIAAIARTTECKSALATQIINVKPYPPFRMVLQMIWVDARTGDILSRLYHDVDVTNSDTAYRFRNFVGQGPAKELYEQLFYSEDLYHSAWLSPEKFMHFVSAYSCKVLFSDRHDVPWWFFWRIF